MAEKKKKTKSEKKVIFLIDAETKRQFGILAAEEERTARSLFIEAVEDLLKKYGKVIPKIKGK